MAKRLFYILIVLLVVNVLFSCTKDEPGRLNFVEQGRSVPAFNAESAYRLIEKQLSFGPRNPSSKGHQQTQKFLLNKLQAYTGDQNVYLQTFTTPGYEADTLDLANIIAAFNTQSSDRIMLCAHWDTRPRADQDSVDTQKPIPGADDGASGVAVLLELARIFHKNPPSIGVDIILFDGEDYGKEGSLDKYFLGSRYWSKNPPVPGYKPRFGILLDMVGGKNAQFLQEGYSLRYAPVLVNELWSIAKEKELQTFFPATKGKAITDDHVAINRILGIPTIDIVRQNNKENGSTFAPYWHTHNDDLPVIDKKTLKAVGSVLAELIYNRI